MLSLTPHLCDHDSQRGQHGHASVLEFRLSPLLHHLWVLLGRQPGGVEVLPLSSHAERSARQARGVLAAVSRAGHRHHGVRCGCRSADGGRVREGRGGSHEGICRTRKKRHGRTASLEPGELHPLNAAALAAAALGTGLSGGVCSLSSHCESV